MRRGDLPGGQEGITFRWGQPGEGTDFKGGVGLSHIIAKHGIESVEEVVETIATGKIIRKRSDRVDIELKESVASLVLVSRGQRESWILTGFAKDKFTGFFNIRDLIGPIFFKNSEGVSR